MLQTISITMLAIFVISMGYIGYRSRHSTKTMTGFLLGGRSVGPWISAFAYGTSYFSAVIFIGYAGRLGWTIGLSTVWIGVCNAMFGSALAWLVLAERTRDLTHKLGAKTMPEFFEGRYNSKNMKVYAALIIFIFLIPYAASVYMGLGYLFNSIFPAMSENYLMLFIAILTAIYLVLGGYTATAITDFIQGIIMIIGVVVMTYFVLANDVVGGLMNGLSQIAALPEGGNLTHIFGGDKWFNLLSLVILTSLGTWGLPQMIHKFYAIKDTQSIKRATVISTAFAFLVGVCAYLVGVFGRLYLNNTVPAEGFDKVMPQVLVTALSGNFLMNILLSVILLLVLSASMSTLSSVVLTSASAIAVDLVGVYFPNMDKKHRLVVIKILCIVFIGFSFAIACFKISFIIGLMSFSWGIVSGSFIGPYVWGLYGKRTTKAGAWAGLLCGIAIVGGCILYTTLAGETFAAGFKAAQGLSPTFGSAAMLASLIIVPLVSAVTKNPQPAKS